MKGIENSKPLTASSYTEIAITLSIQEYTLRKWLKPFENEIGKPETIENGILKFSPRQVRIIFEKLELKK